MAEHPRAQLVRAFYAARARGDRSAIRRILAADIAWHGPYPPPPGGTTRLWLEDVLANDRRAVALVGWSSTYRGRTMEGREVALYTIRDGQIAEARFFPFDQAASDAFFGASAS